MEAGMRFLCKQSALMLTCFVSVYDFNLIKRVRIFVGLVSLLYV